MKLMKVLGLFLLVVFGIGLLYYLFRVKPAAAPDSETDNPNPDKAEAG